MDPQDRTTWDEHTTGQIIQQKTHSTATQSSRAPPQASAIATTASLTSAPSLVRQLVATHVAALTPLHGAYDMHTRRALQRASDASCSRLGRMRRWLRWRQGLRVRRKLEGDTRRGLFRQLVGRLRCAADRADIDRGDCESTGAGLLPKTPPAQQQPNDNEHQRKDADANADADADAGVGRRQKGVTTIVTLTHGKGGREW